MLTLQVKNGLENYGFLKFSSTMRIEGYLGKI